MGKVFTWDALAKGHVPTQEGFMAAHQLFRRAVEDENSIRTALAFGSVVRRDSNCRSDLDCLVLYEAHLEHQAMLAMQWIDRMAFNEHHVCVNYTPCDLQLATTRLHHLGPAFLRHLQAAIEQGGMVKGHLDLVAKTVPEKAEIESYVRAKIFKLQQARSKWATKSAEERAVTCQKYLEAVMHIARKLLIYMGYMSGDSKREVVEAFTYWMPSSLTRKFKVALSVDARYTTEVELQLCKPNAQRYVHVQSRLIYQIETIIMDFLRECALHLNKLM